MGNIVKGLKVGDVVKRIDGMGFSNDAMTVTIERFEYMRGEFHAWLKETHTNIPVARLTLANPPQADNVNQPSHYTAGGIETLDYMKAKLSPEALEGYFAGNVLKYVSRYNHKNGVEDLKKAQFYLRELIELKGE